MEGDFVLNEEAVLNILKDNIETALGCTEPVALAYAGALAKERITGKIKSIKLVVDKNFYKNCLRVTIPKTNLKGLKYAVALGVVGGKSKYKLEVLKDINEENINKAIEMVNSKLVEINIRKKHGLYIEVCLETANDTVRCIIKDYHTNVVLIEHNGSIVFNSETSGNNKKNNISFLDVSTIINFVHEVDIKNLDFLEKSWKMNMQIAREGLKNPQDNFFGAALQKKYADEKIDVPLSNLQLSNYIKVLAAAACDARMNGLNYPVAAIAGSGNQGLISIVPVVAFGEINNMPREKVLRAIALSALITIYVKSKIGVLTPVCGCAIAAGAGVAAALAYLQGGNDSDLQAAVINVIGALTGMICDGAKGGCASKLAVSAGTAFDAAILALEGVFIHPKDGIVGSDVEETISNLSYFINEGMKCSDKALVYIMESTNRKRNTKTSTF